MRNMLAILLFFERRMCEELKEFYYGCSFYFTSRCLLLSDISVSLIRDMLLSFALVPAEKKKMSFPFER